MRVTQKSSKTQSDLEKKGGSRGWAPAFMGMVSKIAHTNRLSSPHLPQRGPSAPTVNIGQLRRPACKGRRNEETGDRRPAEAQLTRPRRKMATRRNARALYEYMESWSIRRSCPAWWKELGTRQGNSAQLDHHWTCWTENDLDVDVGTCGCVDHRQNFGPQSVESINTSAAHILARVNLKMGRVLTTSQEPQPGNWRCHMAGWNQSVGAMEYGTQVATATPASCLELQLHSVWETGCWRSACHRCFLSTKLRTCIHEVRMPPLCFNMRAQPGYRAAELCAADTTAEQSTKRPGCVSTLRWAGAVPIPALPPVNNHWATAVYPHASTAAVPTCVASRRLPAVDMYLHAYSGELAQHLPALPPLDNPPQLCTCTHTRARLLNPKTLPPVDTGPGRVPARTSGRVGTALTGVASHRQAVLDKYMHTWSVKLAQCIPVLPPADNRPQLCRASWHSAHWRCILLTTGPGCVPARILGRARSQPTNAASCQQAALDADLHEYPGDLAQRLLALTPVDQQTWTCICRHVRASWRSACWRCLPLTIGPNCVMRAGAVPIGTASCWQPVPAVYLHAYSESLLTAYRHCPPVDNRPWARTCTYTWASWGRITGVASCQTALDMLFKVENNSFELTRIFKEFYWPKVSVRIKCKGGEER